MVTLFAVLALGGDVLVATTVPSVVPMDKGYELQGELLGLGGWLPEFGRSAYFVTGPSLPAAHDLGPKVRIGARVGGYLSREIVDSDSVRIPPGDLQDGEVFFVDRLVPDVSVDISAAVVHANVFRLATFAAVGTYAQVGVALLLSDNRRRVSLDAAYGPSVRLGALLTTDWKYRNAWDIRMTKPEGGVSLALGRKRQHALRLGLIYPMPTIGYRYDGGRVYVKVVAGTRGYAHYGQASVGMRL